MPSRSPMERSRSAPWLRGITMMAPRTEESEESQLKQSAFHAGLHETRVGARHDNQTEGPSEQDKKEKRVELDAGHSDDVWGSMS
eukprot:1067631-Rhodomonas_salina.1